MFPFLSGFIVALVIVVPVVVVAYFTQASRNRFRHESNRRELEELSRLTGGLAHEIKNPLSTIKVNLKLITEEVDSSERESSRWVRKIGVVQKETDRLEQILEDFLRYIGRSDIHPEATDINELVSEMVDFYSPQAQAHSITIRLGLLRRPIVCQIDVAMVKQAILNLFINAQQAMGDGGELIIRTDVRKKEAIIEISDTGIGIEAEKVDKIFEAYYTSKSGGSGLGLPTVAKILKAHNGRITVNSEPGRGTSFTISLPLELNEDGCS